MDTSIPPSPAYRSPPAQVRTPPVGTAATPDSGTALLARARDPEGLLTLAFAGVITRALDAGQRPLIRGLAEADFQRLLGRFFPGVRLVNGDPATPDGLPMLDELEDLRDLLLEHRREPSEELAWLCQAVASAAMRDNHLWQDMGLPSRGHLSRLLFACFPGLAARNQGDMKWKKFFYRQLCERAQVPVCKSPNCADCVDYAVCFGHDG